MVNPKRLILQAMLPLSYFAGCGGPTTPTTARADVSCEDVYVDCEFVAYRSSSSNLVAFVKTSECSYDFGACISGRSTCRDDCNFTLVASSCKMHCP